jgi:hypothetical protein
MACVRTSHLNADSELVVSHLYFSLSLHTHKAMTIYQFTMLDEMEQIECFWSGIVVGKRMEGKYEIECRQVDGFYIEYKKDLDIPAYVDIKAFVNPDLLQHYLEKMGDINLFEL